jgi:hypothetical protein
VQLLIFINRLDDVKKTEHHDQMGHTSAPYSRGMGSNLSLRLVGLTNEFLHAIP